MQMAHLARLLSRVLSTFYTKSGALEQDTVKLFETAQPIWQDLQAACKRVDGLTTRNALWTNAIPSDQINLASHELEL